MDVRRWHQKFNVPVKDEPDLSDKDLNKLRFNLLQEELNELKDAMDVEDKVGVLDALTDLQYVLDGTYLSLGFWKLKNKAFREVQRSNMSKLGSDGKPIKRKDGKVLKGENFFKPNLKQFIGE